ncbi:MAG: hypothetical protein M1835_000172 [Candelina submexicana]|nr:MAG: hypothetical protein M1835_000172 [Candelina submexicana]
MSSGTWAALGASPLLSIYLLAFLVPFTPSASHLIPTKTRIPLIVQKRAKGITILQNIMLWLDPWVSLFVFFVADFCSWLYLILLYQWVKDCEQYKRKSITGPEIVFICVAVTSYFLSIYTLALGYKLGQMMRKLDLEDAFPDEKHKITCSSSIPDVLQDHKRDLEAGPKPCHMETPTSPSLPPYTPKPPTPPPVEVRLAEELALYHKRTKVFEWPSSLGNFIKSPQFRKLSPERQYDTLVMYRFSQKAKDDLCHRGRY